MNKTLVITTIALITVVMGLSTIAPALQQAFAHDVDGAVTPGFGQCPRGFSDETIEPFGTHPDHNFNGAICFKNVGQVRVIIDDVVASPRGWA